MGLRICMLGNFNVSYCSEVHHAKSLEALGHQVFKLQETRKSASQILSIAKMCDMFVWVHTHGWRTPGGSMKMVLAELKRRGIPTVTFHLDLWFGLKRQVDMQKDDVWDIEHFFTVDKLMADWFNEQKAQGKGVTTGHYLQAGVFGDECYLADMAKTKDAIFVGSKGYHNEWAYRPHLIEWLQNNYKGRFTHYGGDGAGTVRGHKLNELYASTKIAVGDTLCLNFDYPYYWSDRVYETLGRGGFLIHPYIKGMEDHFEDKKHLVFYEYNNFGQLKELIEYYLTHDDEREAIRLAGHGLVKNGHTYRHRWEHILKTVFP